MKHDPMTYAKAFAAAAAAAQSADEERALAKRFVEIVVRQGARKDLSKIVTAAERLLREKEGRRKVTVTSARPLTNLQVQLKDFLKKDDIIEEKVDSQLVAGVKITIDDSRQFDASLAKKLSALFSGQRA